MKKLTQNDFINKATTVHGNRYDYSKLVYTNSRSKVTIICKEHGEFSQNANSHILGIGCKKCGKILSSDNCTKITNSYFIEQCPQDPVAAVLKMQLAFLDHGATTLH